MSQCEKIIRYMKDFGSITTMQAFDDLDITRLSARIYDLKALGYKIKTETVKRRNGHVTMKARGDDERNKTQNHARTKRLEARRCCKASQ